MQHYEHDFKGQSYDDTMRCRRNPILPVVSCPLTIPTGSNPLPKRLGPFGRNHAASPLSTSRDVNAYPTHTPGSGPECLSSRASAERLGECVLPGVIRIVNGVCGVVPPKSWNIWNLGTHLGSLFGLYSWIRFPLVNASVYSERSTEYRLQTNTRITHDVRY